MLLPNGQIHWVQSAGGPLLLLTRSLVPEWGGFRRATKQTDAAFRWRGGGPATDYDRACEVADYTGLIPVGTGDALVLGDEPLLTCWLPAADGGLLVRWCFADDEQSVLRHLQGLDGVQFAPTPHILQVAERQHCLFDSAVPGVDLNPEDALPVELDVGSYEVGTVRFQPDASTELLIHRLRIKPRE
jgi:immunity protein 21 of polymorphic toxin system